MGPPEKDNTFRSGPGGYFVSVRELTEEKAVHQGILAGEAQLRQSSVTQGRNIQGRLVVSNTRLDKNDILETAKTISATVRNKSVTSEKEQAKKVPKTKEISRNLTISGEVCGGDYWTRTSDLLRVKQAL